MEATTPAQPFCNKNPLLELSRRKKHACERNFSEKMDALSTACKPFPSPKHNDNYIPGLGDDLSVASDLVDDDHHSGSMASKTDDLNAPVSKDPEEADQDDNEDDNTVGALLAAQGTDDCSQGKADCAQQKYPQLQLEDASKPYKDVRDILGWKYKIAAKGDDLIDNWQWFCEEAGGKPKSKDGKGGTRGVHYFLGEFEVMEELVKHYGWKGDEMYMKLQKEKHEHDDYQESDGALCGPIKPRRPVKRKKTGMVVDTTAIQHGFDDEPEIVVTPDAESVVIAKRSKPNKNRSNKRSKSKAHAHVEKYLAEQQVSGIDEVFLKGSKPYLEGLKGEFKKLQRREHTRDRVCESYPDLPAEHVAGMIQMVLEENKKSALNVMIRIRRK